MDWDLVMGAAVTGGPALLKWWIDRMDRRSDEKEAVAAAKKAEQSMKEALEGKDKEIAFWRSRTEHLETMLGKAAFVEGGSP